MTHSLILGPRAYSSWSLRAWLLFERFDIPRSQRFIEFDTPVADQLAAHPPARTVPTAIFDDGAVVSDSLAIAEELHSRHPLAGLWPEDPEKRAAARNLAAEMHSSFGSLRNDCPMALRVSYSDFTPSDGVKADLKRICDLWTYAKTTFSEDGPWLFGRYTAVDALYAPVAARIATYDLTVEGIAAEYVATHLGDPAFRRWRAEGLVVGQDLARYAKPNAQRAWPTNPPITTTLSDGPSLNETCPFSGKPVAHFFETANGKVGFCNPGCRDKAMQDPMAFPEVARILSEQNSL